MRLQPRVLVVVVSRQLIGRLNKLARSGLWKASFKVFRVEQALHARKVAAAREMGQVFTLIFELSTSLVVGLPVFPVLSPVLALVFRTFLVWQQVLLC